MTTLANNLTIRPGRREDPRAAPRVQVVRVVDPHDAIEAAGVLGEQRAWLERLLGRPMSELDPDTREEYAHPEAYYRSPSAALFVGRVGGFPAGVVAAYRLDPATIELRRLYVRPDARGTGLGRLLSSAVIDHARHAGARRVRLDTIPASMASAVRLYRSLGFRDVPPLAYADLPGIVGMELALGGS